MYVQFPSGLAICWGNFSVAIKTTEKSGFGATLHFGEAVASLKLPFAFAAPPVAVGNLYGRDGWVSHVIPSTTGVDYSLGLSNFSSNSISIRSIVIGVV